MNVKPLDFLRILKILNETNFRYLAYHDLLVLKVCCLGCPLDMKRSDAAPMLL